MTKPGYIDGYQLRFRMGRAEDARPLLEKYGQDFFREVGLDRYSSFDIDQAERKIQEHIKSGNNPYILATINDVIVGVASYTLSHVWTRQPLAIMWMTYVAPLYRNSAIGKLLVDRMLDLAEADGACAFFATVPTMTEGGKALCHLFENYGFEPMGGAFQRRL
jgi:L-amino acid N-acyltransferase YncA